MTSAPDSTGEVKTSPDEFDKEAMSHAWEWFEYHANQRMTMIRYGQNFRVMFVVTMVGFAIMAFAGFWSEVGYLALH